MLNITPFLSILSDEILSQLSTQQGMVGADGRLRNMTCLPEKFITGQISFDFK